MSDELTQPDDLAILALLDALERKPGEGDAMFLPWAEGHAGETEDTLARLYTEVFGLLPYELPLEAPAPAVKSSRPSSAPIRTRNEEYGRHPCA